MRASVGMLWGLLLVVGCTRDPGFSVVMQDSSMEPTFSAREQVGFAAASSAGRGEVVAFEYPFPYPGRPRRELIARVIGLPGDEVRLGPTGVVVNGERLVEPYVKNQERVSAEVVQVPTDSYFVLGDDRANQRDSRTWGPLPRRKLLGVQGNTP